MQTQRSTLAAFAAAGCLLFAPLSVRAETLELTLEETQRRAIDASPDLRIAEQGVALSRAALSEARALAPSDPVLGGTLARRDEGSFGDDWSASLSQTLYFPGQRWAHHAAARLRRAGAESSFRQERREIAARAGFAFVAALASQERAALALEEEELARELVRAATGRLEAGAGGALDANLARLELVRAARTRAEAERASASDRGALLALLAVAAPGDVRLRRTEPVADSAVPPLETLLETARRSRGDLASAHAEEKAASRDRSAARLDLLPRPTVLGEIERDDGADVARIGVSIPLPLLQRNVRPRLEANARLEQARARAIAARATVDAEVASAFAAWEAARRAAAVFDADAVRALEETDGMLEEARRAGKIDFAQRVLLRRDLVEAKRARVDAQAEIARARIELERVVGEDLIDRRTP